jgi:uncharacterized phage protein (TIGR02218 family)
MHTPRNIQAPYTATDFWNNWNSVTPRMSLLIKITPQTFWTSVSAVGLTSNTRNMTVPGHPGVTFYSTPGITPTQVEQVLDDPTNLEMTGIYQTGIFEQEDVAAGKWNFATIEVWSQSWQYPEYGELVHGKCKTGEIKDYQTFFTAEARGMMSQLSSDVNKVTSRFCRVKEFRDAECGHTSATVTIDAVVYNVTQTNIAVQSDVDALGDPNFEFSTADFAGNDPPLDLFSNGKITATSGANNGVSREIAKQLADNDGVIQIILKRSFPFDIATSTTFNLVAGCTRTIEDCMKYDNIVNRRAEDFIPTVESVHRVPPSS